MRAFSRAAVALLLLVLASRGPAVAGPAGVRVIDQRGIPFTLASLPAHALAVTFVASRCGDSCPVVNAAFAQLAARIARSGVSLTLVTLTLDPDFDTPFVMSRVARFWHADPAVWRVASGAPADLHRLMRAFGIVVQPDAMGMPDTHTALVYILGAHRTVTHVIPLSTALPDDVLTAVGHP